MGEVQSLTQCFMAAGTIHLFFEGRILRSNVELQCRITGRLRDLGYFAFNHASMPGMQDFFGQLWKEYAMSDSRYLTSDPFVLCMETVTAVGLETVRVGKFLYEN